MTLISIGIAFLTTVPTATGTAPPPAPPAPRPPRPLALPADAAVPSSPAHPAETRNSKAKGKMRDLVRMTKYQSVGYGLILVEPDCRWIGEI
jgi:hypothetical protein